VKGAILSKFRNMGQTCVCANRFLVQDSVYDAFAERLKKAVAALKVGDGAAPGIEQGPLINMAAVEKVESLITDGVNRGARVDLGGKRHKLGGTFFEPTIMRDATPDMAFAREEIFGPVVTLFRFAKDEDAIRMANDTEYGLAAYFYARDVGRIFKVMEGLQYGIVGVNEGIISTEVAPFGGMKESGIGREGSKYGIDDFVQIKYVAMGGLGIP
jgi:succinate-semialdehyde dehydrogenase/glutarate-semialdehyde dehydrogenase